MTTGSTHVLITGGAGFIGTNLALYLRDRRYRVTILDNESLGKREYVAPYCEHFVQGDILDRALLSELVCGKDIVIHLAADTRVLDSIACPETNFAVNVQGTFNLLNICRDAGVPYIVNASTGGAILGEAPTPINESMVPAPLSPYGASKLATEGYCSAFMESYGMRILSLRFSNVYGPHSYHKGSVIAHFIKSILKNEPLTVYGDGTQVRDYIFTSDLMDGIHNAMNARVTGVFQLGSGRPVMLNELIDTLRRVTGHTFDVLYKDARSGEIHTTWCDTAKAKAAFGFAPATSLEDGVRKTWEWFTGEKARAA